MLDYDNTIDPSIPIVKAKIWTASVSRVKAVDVFAWLDTGADITVLPRGSLKPLLAHEGSDYCYVSVGGFSGNTIRKRAYYVYISIEHSDPYLVQVIENDDSVGLLGRDVLNRLRLDLNGPSQSWAITNC